MGTPAICNSGTAKFSSKELAKAAYELFLVFVEFANDGLEPEANTAFTDKLRAEMRGSDFDISDVSLANEVICFSAASGRVQNLEWQLDRIQEFLVALPGAVEFSADIMVQGDGRYWSKE